MSLIIRSFSVYSRIFPNRNSTRPLFVLQSRADDRSKSRKSAFTNNFHTSFCANAKLQFNLSDIGEGIREVVVKEWFVKIGDRVSQFDNICEVQSDKASVTITSRYDGIVTKLYYKVDDTAAVGNPLVEIDADGEDNEGAIQGENETKREENMLNFENGQNNNSDFNGFLCIPSVRRLAKEHNINLSKVMGTGKKGRILKEDILNYLDSLSNVQMKAGSGGVQLNDRIEPIKGFQKAMFKSMTDSLKIPHFVYSDEISVSKLTELRRNLKNDLEERNLKISFMPFFIKAASNALSKYPLINSQLVDNEDKICYKSSHNIGIAMDTTNGLAVPVIQNVNNLSVFQIATELSRLMKSGKEGNFSTNDLTGATFTISNIGIIGGTYTKPVIMSPQVAIVAIGAAKLLPRFDADKNVIADEIVSISAAADHRVIDGATMAHFVNLFKKQLENPYLVFFNL